MLYYILTIVTVAEDVKLNQEVDSVKGEEEFKVVSKRKRKNGEEMESEDGTKSKRPSFPPVNASTTLVTNYYNNYANIIMDTVLIEWASRIP